MRFLMRCVFFALFVTGFLPLPAADPISLHPDNPHYFSFRGEPTILITSGEHYGALLNRKFDYLRYFDELASHGLNHTRVFSGVYLEIPASFGITDNPLAPTAKEFVCPWVRSDFPGASDGGNKFDLTRWNPAWKERLVDLMQAADERGIVVEMTLFCPMYKDELWNVNPMNAANNINGVGDCPREELYTLKHQGLTNVQIAFSEMIVNELKDFDNFYYEICNEPYFGGITMQWQHKIADVIAAAQQNAPKKHLISMNIANGRQKIENPDPNVSIFNFHYCVPPTTVAMNFGLNKVIGENETGFRGNSDVLYRTEAWDFLLAGGGLFNNLDYSFTPSHPDGTRRDYSSPGGGSVELREQLGILKEFLYQLPFIEMSPSASVVASVEPELSVEALGNPGEAYAFYLHVPLPSKPQDLSRLLRDNIEANITVDLPSGAYRAEWVDTKTGKVAKQQSIVHEGGKRTLTSPRFSNDVALRILKDE
ncbi:hypothetical protein CA13_26430 [Planctomycetes bacterium CA13]|uniref:Glycoside hydrolase family 5 domain-containing protein n=2 Tax=Novipirellula herctigrandis TaxID=2527986 RepID=A0A5C5Z1R1_9BACT|nr:hypothetical protein CA13_26430 [Planctomycetes bacterium CA13]